MERTTSSQSINSRTISSQKSTTSNSFQSDPLNDLTNAHMERTTSIQSSDRSIITAMINKKKSQKKSTTVSPDPNPVTKKTFSPLSITFSVQEMDTFAMNNLVIENWDRMMFRNVSNPDSTQSDVYSRFEVL